MAAIDFSSAKPVNAGQIDFASAQPVSAQPTTQQWGAGDYARAAGKAAVNLPGDILTLGGEAAKTGADVLGAAMPWNWKATGEKVFTTGRELAKTGAGEIELGLRNLGINVKTRPGKEAELEQFVAQAKALNTQISQSARSEEHTSELQSH